MKVNVGEQRKNAYGSVEEEVAVSDCEVCAGQLAVIYRDHFGAFFRFLPRPERRPGRERKGGMINGWGEEALRYGAVANPSATVRTPAGGRACGRADGGALARGAVRSGVSGGATGE